MTISRSVFAPLACSVFLHAAVGAEPDQDWMDWDVEERVAAVSGGELRLLPEGVPDGVHVHRNLIRITAESLSDGWVSLEQCHEDLDQVPAVEVTFNPERIRGLRVTESDRIGSVRVEGHRVQLKQVGPRSRLCIVAESRSLWDVGSGRYRLRNGPYMRRFLDGYYPMSVRIEIRYPTGLLEFSRSAPNAQPGFRLRDEPGLLLAETAFEGMLYTCFDFRGEEADGKEMPELPCGAD